MDTAQTRGREREREVVGPRDRGQVGVGGRRLATSVSQLLSRSGPKSVGCCPKRMLPSKLDCCGDPHSSTVPHLLLPFAMANRMLNR